MSKKTNEIYRDAFQFESEINFPWADRIRLIFGSKLYVTLQVKTQWRFGLSESASAVKIDKFIPRLKKSLHLQ